MQAASAKGNINTATSEFTKTYDWFKNVVFPAVENNQWPVTADQDYIVAYGDDIRKSDTDLNRYSTFIAKGTKFVSQTDQKPLHTFANGKPEQLSVTSSLLRFYEMLEQEVIFFKLNVPMESFPD